MEAAYSQSPSMDSMNMLIVSEGVVLFCLGCRTGYELAPYSTARAPTPGLTKVSNPTAFPPTAKDIFLDLAGLEVGFVSEVVFFRTGNGDAFWNGRLTSPNGDDGR